MTLFLQSRVRRYAISNGEFVKCGLLRPDIEFEKGRALHALSKRSGFRAPEALREEPESGCVVYRFIPGLVSIRESYLGYMTARRPSEKLLGHLHAAGVVLARIHSGLDLSSTIDWEPSDTFASAFHRLSGRTCERMLANTRWVVAHGDYGFSNVCVFREGAQEEIAVVDPAANGFVTFASNVRAPIYIDIANFSACLEGLVPLHRMVAIRWNRLHRVRDEFIRGYEETAAYRVDRRLLSHVAYATALCYLKHKHRNALVQRLALNTLYNRIKGNLPA